jgi:hypothetical protein
MAMMGGQGDRTRSTWSQPKELLQFLPYTIHFHFKFWEMLENFTEYSIPFDGVIAALKEGGYDGWICSEYERTADSRSGFLTASPSARHAEAVAGRMPKRLICFVSPP